MARRTSVPYDNPLDEMVFETPSDPRQDTMTSFFSVPALAALTLACLGPSLGAGRGGARRLPVRTVVVLALAVTAVSACDLAGGGSKESPNPEASARAPDRDLQAAPVCSPAANGLPDGLRRIDDLLATRYRVEAIPGVAGGVVCGDSLIFARGYGVMALDDSTHVTPATLFRIASVTKLFTATAVVMLDEAGALGLDDPVKEHLPWFEIVRPPETGTAPITVRHLLTHTSGLPRDSRLTNFSRLYQPPRQEAIAALPDQRLEAPPGEAYAYSNLGYGVLGELIAEASGTSYAEYLESRILRPLEMSRTLVHPTPGDHTAWGHEARRPDDSRGKADFWDLGFATPAGGMASSVEDLARFVRFQLAPYNGLDPPLLPAEEIRDMHSVHHVMDPSRGGSGFGWGVEVSNDQHIVYHGGELPEQTSFVLIDLKVRIGVVVLTNARDADAGALAQEILRLARVAVAGPGARVPERAIPPG